MNAVTDMLGNSVIRYCAQIGRDPMLVQGAGGNVSWKDGDTMWVKASGTWLADAEQDAIFVPVDQPALRGALERGDFSVMPQVRGESALKPSIETLLHVLMPQRVVAHLHAIEILVHLVREDCEATFRTALADTVSWVAVDYHKPGAPLAQAASLALAAEPSANVILMKNHGVVIGADDVAEMEHILDALMARLASRPVERQELANNGKAIPQGYLPVEDVQLHQLACDPRLYERLRSDWALYPDHVVFLGASAHLFESADALHAGKLSWDEMPEVVFIRHDGVYVKPGFNRAKQAQLRCYYDVIVRQGPDARIKPLNDNEIAALLNWDAEQYRMKIAK
ncbi:class II aldolase/adducin family protein [Paraburkholderia hayleyella]|uniref:class II aldolase/adducin family protein n=1 Tax=Paraburkholderia hayleyella TaxID=2152889 RepID=UPI001292712D|nr:class II aldolase/adducin family protein [Paraburkholderia hayleyella]